MNNRFDKGKTLLKFNMKLKLKKFWFHIKLISYI